MVAVPVLQLIKESKTLVSSCAFIFHLFTCEVIIPFENIAAQQWQPESKYKHNCLPEVLVKQIAQSIDKSPLLLFYYYYFFFERVSIIVIIHG